MDKATMRTAIINRWENERGVGLRGVIDPALTDMADMALEALETVGALFVVPVCPAPNGPCTCTNGIGCVNTPMENW